MSFNNIENTYITIMNFSNIYKKENFYKNENINWIDCSHVNGTNCYCDEHAERTIKELIKDIEVEGIHFIDSGNYHYVSEFWMDKINENFNLVVFDHHSDMQKPMFGDILSCGSWIMNCLDKNRYLQKVILIGVGEDEKKLINNKYKDRIVCIDKDNLKIWDYEDNEILDYPVYISIDKDVLSSEIIKTDWSQGDMDMSELECILHRIIKREDIIGIDICGECRNELDKLADINENDWANSEILQFLKNENNIIKQHQYIKN